MAAWVSGGFLPEAVRGSTHSDGIMHIADWYHTFCKLAGCDPSDNAKGVPPPEAFDLWPTISTTGTPSPRRQACALASPTMHDSCGDAVALSWWQERGAV